MHISTPLNAANYTKSLHTQSSAAVADENGEPLVVYRGAEFDPLAQKPGKGVIKPEAYFTADSEYANRYTGNGGKVRSYYLNIRHPFDIRDPECLKDLQKIYPDHNFARGESGALDWAEASVVEGEFLKENFGDKYDGVIYDEGGDPAEGGPTHRGISYVPLDGGAQAKSATDNNGDFSGENSDIRFKRATPDEMQRVVEHFGTTRNLNEAGYILPDGRLLDLSGRRDGARGGNRTLDHRAVWDVLDDRDNGGDAMMDFMFGGAVRIMPESGGISLTVRPTDAQLDALERFVIHNDGEADIDFMRPNGDSGVSVSYETGTRPSRILNEIKRYFDEGVEPRGTGEQYDGSVRFKRNPAFEHSLDALQAIADGADYGVLHNAKYGEVRYPLGRSGKGGMGFLHIVQSRMDKDGATLDEAIDTAIKVGQAVEIGEETAERLNTRHFDYDGVRAIVAWRENDKAVITGYEIDGGDSAAAVRRAGELAPRPHVSSEEVAQRLRNRVANLRAESQGGIRYKSAPRAPVDDSEVLFGARASRKAHGLDDLTAEESNLAYTDKELYSAGQRIAKDVPHMLNAVNDALTSDRALPLEDTFALTVFLRNQMDALADVHAKMQNGNAASFRAEEEYLSAIVEKASKAVARNNTKLAGLRVARLGVMLDTARDTEAWLTQEVRTRRAAQGLPPELSEADKAMIKRMAEQLKKANDENEALRKQIADLQSERVTERRAKENVAKGKSAAKRQTLSPERRAKAKAATGLDFDDRAAALFAGLEVEFGSAISFKGGENTPGLSENAKARFAGLVDKFGWNATEKLIKSQLPKAASAWAEFRRQNGVARGSDPVG